MNKEIYHITADHSGPYGRNPFSDGLYTTGISEYRTTGSNF